ncbi:MAG: class I SAM-dependent methyltransferase [Peptococcaceae bacterium]|nr:class I SAM-dependent methyltransferase [Peptococcaceae bacterium]
MVSILDGIIKEELYFSDGIWYSDSKIELSYPDDGYDICFQVEDNSFWFNHRNKCIAEMITHFSPDATIFDVGGGNGYVSLGLANAGFDVVLIEPSIKGALNAKKRGLKKIICSTLENSIQSVKQIPSIGLFDVLEHIEDDNKFLRDIKSFLTDDGMLYISVPAYNALWSLEDIDAGHFRRYTLENLISKLTKAGFNVEYATYIFAILPVPIFLFRKIPSSLGIKHARKSAGKDHSYNSNSNVSKLLDKLWTWELKNIKQRKRIPIGGSCLIAARVK